MTDDDRITAQEFAYLYRLIRLEALRIDSGEPSETRTADRARLNRIYAKLLRVEATHRQP